MLEALACLSLDGCMVTADALPCRADTANAILNTDADYALACKSSQPTLLAQARGHIEAVIDPDRVETINANVHDRTENPPCNRGRRHRHGVSRHRGRRATGEHPIARTHWSIENELHWVLDVAFCEDAARNCKNHGPQNLSTLRKIALNIIRLHPEKASIRRKIKKAGWDDEFLIYVIAHKR